ncbi:TonB-dependent receptor [Phenylobacterium sp. LjRoot225]|uniref:TonB-dependent receptor n=1 Tax=Phenylobacterium sp. LjRoot225 TaxID=3342285 RepID=UPI003ED04112
MTDQIECSGAVARRRLAFCGAAVAALVCGSAVVAQEAGTNSASSGGGALEEVVVTARKRTEDLQRTPISITAMSGEALEARGVTQVTELSNFTPNLIFQNIPSNSGVASNASVYIRGIGQNDFAPTIEPGVGIYVDGVYLGRTVGGVFDLIDVERVEVLRGPQGTLFGRNTIGGAVSLTTQEPGPSFGFKGDVKYGTDNLVNVRGSVNLPINDAVALRLSGGQLSQDGYVKHPFDGRDLGNKVSTTLRGALKAELTPDLKVVLAADYFLDKSHGPPVVITGVGDLEGFVALQNALAATGAPPPSFGGPGDPSLCLTPAYLNTPGCYNSRYFSTDTNYGSGPNYSRVETWSTSGTVTWNLGPAEVKSITAYRHLKGAFAQDRDGSPIKINHVADTYNQEQFSQELQLQGNVFDDRMNWLVGLYYFTEDGANLNPVDFLPVALQSGGRFNYKSWAAFTQETFRVTDKLSLTAGLRYTDDKKDYTPDQFFTALPFGPLFTCYIPTVHACAVGDRVVPNTVVKARSNAVTPMVNVSYQVTGDAMAYATFSKGYKSGGFTQRIFPPEQSLPSFNPEHVDSYETGVKYQTADHRVRLNLSAYLTKYRDLQLLVADATRVGPFYTNAGRAEIKGFEAEFSAAPGGGWRLDATAGLTAAKYTELANNVQGLTLDSKFALVPKWTLSGGVENRLELGAAGSLLPRLDVIYRSGVFTNANGVNHPKLYQPAYAVANASVRWTNKDGRYFVVAGVDNLTDKKFRTFGDYQASFGFYMEGFDRGRQWYLRSGVDF